MYANPNNPLNPGAFLEGGFIASSVNNPAFPDRQYPANVLVRC